MKRSELLSRLENSMLIIGKSMHKKQLGHGNYSPAQSHVLMMLCMEGPVSIKQLAQVLRVTSGAATQHTDALEKAGLVLREPNPNNRREVVVKVSEKGKQQFDKIKKIKTDALSELFGELSDDEMRTLVGLIEKVSQKYLEQKGNVHGKI